MEEIMKLVYRLTVVLAVVAVLATPVLAADKKVRWKLAMTWSSTLTPFAHGTVQPGKNGRRDERRQLRDQSGRCGKT
jgi:TRAP-type mannitol/chloroaromatic compound transport system substrate-binding protein